MNGITHKQAIKWIDHRLDDLLNENQLVALDEHLRSCDLCRADAARMDELSARLQNEFHLRWDDQADPSQDVVEHVTIKARNIPMTNRVSSGVRLIAGIAALILTVFFANVIVSQLRSVSSSGTASESNNGTPFALLEAENRLLAFASEQDGDFDIYTMQPDGSGLTNLTNNPARDANPIWSPDGRRIAFESDRGGSTQVYVMGADGSNVIQLTQGEVDHRLPINLDRFANPWSPDGHKLLFFQGEPNNETTPSTLYSMDSNGENKTMLASGHIGYSGVSWSPDGRYIVYSLNESSTPRERMEWAVYIIDADGGNPRELKKLLPDEEDLVGPYHWASGGQTIVFVANTPDTSMQAVYEFDLETDTIIQRTESKAGIWEWSQEAALGEDYSQPEMILTWQRPDRTINTLEIAKAWDLDCSMDFTRSLQGNFAMGVYCPSTQFDLYWTNTDGSMIKQLLASPLEVVPGGVGDIAWSPDDQYIAFNIESPNETNMYVVNVDESLADPSIQPLQIPISNGEGYSNPSWRPVINNNVVKEEPTPEPTQTSYNGLIAFTSKQDGNFDIYTMRADGSELTNLTNDPAYDAEPFWSPDGKRIAFESGRNGHGQIFLMNADGSNVIPLTDDETDHMFVNYHNDSGPWSPDGSKLVVSQGLLSDEKWTLSTIDANGENETSLVEEPNLYSAISWSPDGKQVAFIADDPQNLGGDRLYVVHADGSNLREVTKSLQQNEQLSNPNYYWSPDGQSIFFLAFFQKPDPYWTAYEVNVADNSLIEHTRTNSFLNSWRNGIIIVTSSTALKWMRPDETVSTLDLYEKCQQTNAAQSGFYMERSSNGNLLINAYCPNGDFWFYWANSDGTVIKQLIDSPLSAKDSILRDVSWSSDDKFLTLNMASSDKSDVYILNVSESLKDPSILPVKMTNSLSPSWQPVPDTEIVDEQPTPQPTQTSNSGLIAFTSDQSGNLDIYTIRADSSEITNITSDPANDYSPLWSPDGQKIVFITERTRNADIFIMDSDGSNLSQLTDNPGTDSVFSWSRDGQKLVYLAFSDDDPNISQLMIMNADGGNKTALTAEPGPYSFLSWSPDGQSIVYSKLSPDNTIEDGYYVISVDDQPLQEKPIHHNSYIHWEDSEHFLDSIWNGVSEQPQWIVRRFNINDDPPLQPSEVASHDSLIVVFFKNTYVVESGTTMAWYSMDGNPTPLHSWRFNTQCQQPGDPFIQETNHAVSTDGTRTFVTVYCREGRIWFYLANMDGSDFRQLTDFSVETSQVNGGVWSPDGKYVIVTIATNEDGSKTDLYLFDIEEMLEDPSRQPIRLTTDEAWKPDAAWQPNH